MGCEIHMFVEQKQSGSWWLCDVGAGGFHRRNYALFAALAGVRNYHSIEPIAKPKGLPSDVSWTAKENFEEWDADAHNASWLSLDELERYDWTQSLPPTGPSLREAAADFVETFLEILRLVKRLDYIEDVRIVFWFDN